MQVKSDCREPILTQREIAKRWNVSLDTVRRRCAAGELKVIRLSPRRVGILASEEERYLREHEGHRRVRRSTCQSQKQLTAQDREFSSPIIRLRRRSLYRSFPLYSRRKSPSTLVLEMAMPTDTFTQSNLNGVPPAIRAARESSLNDVAYELMSAPADVRVELFDSCAYSNTY